MSLTDRIKSDAMAARKAGDDKVAKSLLVTLSAAVAKIGKDDGQRETTDSEAVAEIKTFMKNSQKTLEALPDESDPRGDVARRELEILAAYLPAAVSNDALRSEIQTILSGFGKAPYPKSAMGTVMKGLRDKFGDAFDGKTMTPVVKEMIG
ncbi:GatB/YqeY domain-containing protein [Roseibium sp. RKSG952]|uniref:GatB/YqeY domain-containing protein n=1 Tax=Roseibium sp. RKSG952 TaxID=2529384 RepID=UPI0012BD183C|nr:GatB/YqeY domain-containing protein [Roseibium sp. RKSG952]MTH95527.1 hypothetical protein [Roseibium sp. RKSG952]